MIGNYYDDYEERVYSEAFLDGYDYAQREFGKFSDSLKRVPESLKKVPGSLKKAWGTKGGKAALIGVPTAALAALTAGAIHRHRKHRREN